MEARMMQKPDQQHFQLSLRIRHPSMDPADLSRELEIEPVHSFRVGDPRASRTGLATASVHTESYWLAMLNPDEWPADMSFPGHTQSQVVEERLEAAATKTLGRALSLSTTRFFAAHAKTLRRIRSEGGQISLLVAIYPGEVSGFSLATEVSQVFGELGITVEFDLTNA
jgi:hypothetical protein